MPAVTRWTLDLEHLEHALRVTRKHCVRTPIVGAAALGPDVFLKLETEQHTGAFKVRGAFARLAKLRPNERARGVVTASAGNHGLGLAWAARDLGIAAKVFLPRSTPDVKRDGIAFLGAEVEVLDVAGYDEADAVARARAIEGDATFVSAFDDPWVAAGNGGSIAVEIFEAFAGARTIVVPVGGGGLAAGLVHARDARAPDVAIVGVQSAKTDAMHRSIERGAAIVATEPVETVCEGLEGGVAESTFELVREGLERIDLVSEGEIEDAIAFASRELDVDVEGSAATAIALARRSTFEGPVVIVVTGANIDHARRDRILLAPPR
jgi:threonine dehydratase